jgi:hypothetical protein
MSRTIEIEEILFSERRPQDMQMVEESKHNIKVLSNPFE